MKFWHRVALMPALAGLAFLGVLLLNAWAGTRNARLIAAIQREYRPALDLSRGLEQGLAEVQHKLEDAVAASDLDELAEAAAISDRALRNLSGADTEPALTSGALPAFERDFRAYFALARDVSARMIAGDRGDSLQSALYEMSGRYNRLRVGLASETGARQAAMDTALRQTQRNQESATTVVTAILGLALLALGIVSTLVIRSTHSSIAAAIRASNALSAGDLSADLPAGPADEIGQLLRQLIDAQVRQRQLVGRLSEAQRLAHLGSWEWEVGPDVITWSSELASIFGYPGPPLRTYEDLIALVHPDDRFRVRKAVEAALRERTPVDFEHRIVKPGGEVRVLHARGNAVLDGSGKVARLVGTAQDVTEFHETAAALRDSEERYRSLFESNPVPMWVYDRGSLLFLAVNDAAVAAYGYTRAELLDMTILDIHPPEDADARRESVAPAPPGLEESGMRRHRRKDGSLLDVEISSQGLSFAGHEARLVFAIDVTERRRLEEQLRQAQKMEAVGRLAGGVAHDFNNLLGVITGYSEILLSRLPAGGTLHRKASHIIEASQRAANLTRQLLAFSRKQVLQPRVLDLTDVVDEMEEMLRRLIGEDIQLSVIRPDALGRVEADAGQMEQVLMNLAANARDAMPNGGRLIIEMSDVLLDLAHVRQNAGALAGPHVLLAVRDTGHGMDAATRSRVFEPFFTTKELGSGTGLGLATVYGIVKQSGGQIAVDSEIGRGTTFKIYLPRVDVPLVAKPASATTPAPGGTETVLLVEDEPALRGVVRETLENAGYRVLDGSTPIEGLELARCRGDAVDVILTDVIMPGMNGREFAIRAAESCPRAQVVFMSGYTDEAIGRHGLLDGETYFLQKPFSVDALLRKLRLALDAPASTGAGAPAFTAP